MAEPKRDRPVEEWTDAELAAAAADKEHPQGFAVAIVQHERREKRAARAAGFASVAELQAHRDREIQLARAAAETEQAGDRRANRLRSAYTGTSAGVRPEMHAAIIAGALEHSEALAAVQAWRAVLAGDATSSDGRKPRALVLSGLPGTGKSVAAAWAVAEIGNASVVHAAELAARVAPYGFEIERGVVPLRFTSTVVLEDLGAESSPKDPRFVDAFLALVENRIAGGGLIVTTNVVPRDLRPRYGSRIAERLNEIARVVLVAGANLRGRGPL